MLELGLAGNPILHSLSPAIFERFFRRARIEGRYDLFQLQSAQEIQGLFETRKNLKGVNVTIPFKRSVVPLLDWLDATALKCGSVNVIKKLSDGQLAGYNTDIAGFSGALRPFISAFSGPVLVLGGGGASGAAAAALHDQKLEFYIVSRHPAQGQLAYEDLTPSLMQDCTLIVHATPCGMRGFPTVLPPFPIHLIRPHHILLDMVYQPRITPFMEAFRQRGARAVNGLRMLWLQALESWTIFKA